MIGYKSPLMHTALGNYNFIVSINAENAKILNIIKNKSPATTVLQGCLVETMRIELTTSQCECSALPDELRPTRRMPVL